MPINAGNEERGCEMTDEQKHAIEHAQKVLRAVKLYDLATSLAPTQGADALLADCGETLPGEFDNAEDLIAAMRTWKPVAEGVDSLQGADAQPVAITEAMAEEMGAIGSPHSEPERLLFEAYCKGHCWAVGEWNGKHYVDMADSIRFAYWRDRAALATREAAPILIDRIKTLCRNYIAPSGRTWECGANDMAVKVLELIAATAPRETT